MCIRDSNGIGRPLALLAGVVAAGAARPTVFQRPRREDLLLCEHTGYLSRTVPGKAEAVSYTHLKRAGHGAVEAHGKRRARDVGDRTGETPK